ncbi:MAG TPA: DUF3866 family protein [Bacillota bacterium]|nr:DUF3866 family protein [Bacillota bacterium]HOL11008.1 DUF3866 family protein [Bacillota bacterium]HPO97461.1 DUF3866 family protein [Bacillota bacterium]
MFDVAWGLVTKVISDGTDLQELAVRMDDGTEHNAYNYPAFNKRLTVGERVALNVTAVKLGLGTGGRHFVLPEYNDELQEVDAPPKGHIMKLRYTPWQFPILAAEEEAGPHHQTLKDVDSLNGTPVVAASLHSMLPGIILGFRQQYRKPAKIVYIMNDAAALPIALSNLVKELKQKKLLDLTITAGNAFGGDLEAVSIPSAMLTAGQAEKADLIIVGLGPGIVGTGTKLGFSGIELSWVIDLTVRLNGNSIMVPRISGADPRARHFGLSHHTVTILKLASQKTNLPLSTLLEPRLRQEVLEAIKKNGLFSTQSWYATDEPSVLELFAEYGIKVKSMGRGVDDDPAFFQSTVAAGYLAALVAENRQKELTKIE